MNRIDYLLQCYVERTETAQERLELMELIASGHYRDVIEEKFAQQLRDRMPEAGTPAEDSIAKELNDVRARFDFLRSPEAKEVRMFSTVTLFRAAAAVLILAICFATWRYVAPIPVASDVHAVAQTSSVTSSGGITKVILADGTLVWLKGSSTINYPATFTGGTRRVRLQGEALFEVAKDASHPFIIQCGGLTTTVLGTSFNIKAIEDKIEVVVLTGRVSLSSDANEESLVVLPNEKAVYNGAKKQLAKINSAAQEEERIAVLEGTEYSMKFEDAPMDAVIRKMENKFNVDVSLADAGLGHCRVTADFTDQSLESTLVLIAEALSLEYQIDGSEVRLSGPGCN